VLILTPDAVGSTLLQRLITIYMQFHDFDRPVINLHELTNGLEKYYSPEFNREIVSKRKVKNWGYYQSLEEIVELLSSVDHYKTSRLAQYHMNGRQDPKEKQIPFYQYLDDNFFIIACRRHNIFEHALSMSVNKITKKLNVYSHQEKIDAFVNIYKEPTVIDERVFVGQLEAYKEYLDWSDRHFNIGSYFYYDEHVENIERYILNLPMFDGQRQKITWKDKFDIDFNDWNRLHHIPSDLGSLPSSALDLLRLQEPVMDVFDGKIDFYQQMAPIEWPPVSNNQDLNDLPGHIKKEFSIMLRQQHISEVILKSNKDLGNFVRQNFEKFQTASDTISRMQELDILVSPPPIKKQTLSDKIKTIKNFKRCLEIYNQWISDHPDLGKPLTDKELDDQQQKEQGFWRQFKTSTELFDQSTIEKLGYQNDDHPGLDPVGD
jgi:hypothetical protein